MNYYISDLHLFHEAAIRFDDRPFQDLEEMHAEIVKRFAKLLLTGAQGDIETAKTKCYQEVMDYVSEHEMEFHPAFDGFLFGHAMRLKLGLPKVPYMD